MASMASFYPFKKNCVISFGFEKYSKNNPNNYVIFQGLGMILIMETNSINQ
jgi:hypothetical protein